MRLSPKYLGGILVLTSVIVLFEGVAYRNDLLDRSVLAHCCNNGLCVAAPCASASTILIKPNCSGPEYSETCRECIDYERDGVVCNRDDKDDYCLESDGVTRYYVCPLLSVTVSGPSYLGCNAYGTYSANRSGGTPGYSYAWYQYTVGGSGWVYIGSGSSVQAGGVSMPFQVKVIITDGCEAANGPRTAEGTKSVQTC